MDDDLFLEALLAATLLLVGGLLAVLLAAGIFATAELSGLALQAINTHLTQ